MGRGALLGPEESGRIFPRGELDWFFWVTATSTAGSLRISGVGVGVWLGPAFTKPLVMVF